MKTKKLVMIALLIAMNIVLTRIIRIVPIPQVRISAVFIVYAITGAMYGPFTSAFVAVAGDLLGFILLPEATQFFVGYTISSGVSGALYGALKRKGDNWKVLAGVVFITTLVVEMGLTTMWSVILFKVPFLSALMTRLPGITINFALKCIVLYPLMKGLYRFLPKED